jgi:hypothetical protein
MVDPLSLAAGIAGLASLAIQVSQLTFGVIGDITDYPEEIRKLVAGTRELSGLLCTIKSIIESRDFQNSSHRGVYFTFCRQLTS